MFDDLNALLLFLLPARQEELLYFTAHLHKAALHLRFALARVDGEHRALRIQALQKHLVPRLERLYIGGLETHFFLLFGGKRALHLIAERARADEVGFRELFLFEDLLDLGDELLRFRRAAQDDPPRLGAGSEQKLLPLLFERCLFLFEGIELFLPLSSDGLRLFARGVRLDAALLGGAHGVIERLRPRGKVRPRLLDDLFGQPQFRADEEGVGGARHPDLEAEEGL